MRLRGTQLDLLDQKLATHGIFLILSNLFISFDMINSLQMINISTKKLVKKSIDIIDIIIAKHKIPDLSLEILFTSFSDSSPDEKYMRQCGAWHTFKSYCSCVDADTDGYDKRNYYG